MAQANVMLDTLLTKASGRHHNYIIDQTNVFKSARKRKLRSFVDFHKTVVMMFPKPEELKVRSDKRFKEMGKEVPAEAVNNMKANYVFPLSKDMLGSDELFDQVVFVELDRGEAQRHLDQMKHAQRSVFSPNSQTNQSPRSHKIGSGDWQSSYPPPPQLYYGYRLPNQVNPVYQGVGSYSEAYQGYQNHPMPRAPTPYGNYSSNERSSVLETEPITLRVMVPCLGVELILTKAMQLLTPTANPVLGLILIG